MNTEVEVSVVNGLYEKKNSTATACIVIRVRLTSF